MDISFYLNLFQKAADQIDRELLEEKQIEVWVGIFLDSVCLKLYKKSWTNDTQNPLTAESRIFFSVWISDSTLEKGKIKYNIHALKLRNLKNYSIQSRKFAEIFREAFKMYETRWPNVSVNHGPLTLMEGWMNADFENVQKDIFEVANNFMAIEYWIDETLQQFKK
ncbi:hypothetical protein SAMN05444397_101522 [Flavobacterium aquidurense]|uniref:Uncharacterized protein n=1 Tax=Flavobacterium frigidimaris TaxID=262320 RepID=A0ABX4BJE1_FLAFR|nr:hypothetical protein [Flavobacterium frigidimaris]OXA75437.1 hypothetical protein B0A65_22140 [Flavobacterium frigidimaris]SDY38859.1 hypothetical protein SAMN05444397_101522 [Flavobacterium aquidurense]